MATNIETARAQMLAQQVRAWEVLDSRVLEAMRAARRELYVPERYRDLAFADTEIPLGHQQHMMSPKLEGRLLQALSLEPVDQVLEIGTGSGFLTACLAQLAEKVDSIDIIPEFVDGARGKLDRQGVRNASLAHADALKLDHSRKFDAIAVTGSVPELDEHFIRMLRPGGRLFIVVGRLPIMEARLITMDANGEWTEESLFETVLAPLINAEQPEPFTL